MKKGLLTLSISTLLLSVGGVASATPVEQSSVIQPVEGSVTVTFEPAPGEMPIITPQDQEVPLTIGSTYLMSGAHWVILYGENVVKLSGNKAIMIGYGTAQVMALKSNGDKLGVYTFVVEK